MPVDTAVPLALLVGRESEMPVPEERYRGLRPIGG